MPYSFFPTDPNSRSAGAPTKDRHVALMQSKAAGTECMSLELSVLLTAECESYQQILKVLMAASCCTVRQKDAALIP